MGNDTRDAVGVDISKAHLDVHRLNTGEAAQFGNDAAGFEALAAWIGSSADEVVYESTGPWHRAFEEALVERLPLTRVNALRARRFAQAMGQEAKTDKADAQVLARMGAALPLRRVAPRSATRRDLDRTAHGAGRAGEGPHGGAQPAAAGVPPAAEAAVEESARPGRAAARGAGRGDRAADRGRRGAVAGRRGADLDPRHRAGYGLGPARGDARTRPSGRQGGGQPGGGGADDARSGQWKGRSFIHGGRARVRRMLYMAALSASQHNPDLARKYQELTTRGKPPKVALTAVMRKLVVLANTLLAQDRTWSPDGAPTAA